MAHCEKTTDCQKKGLGTSAGFTCGCPCADCLRECNRVLIDSIVNLANVYDQRVKDLEKRLPSKP